jgi:hypothetical protein
MNLRPDEVLLDGKLELVDGKVRADAITVRIRALAKGVLTKMGTDPSGWDTLYQDPQDGRYWELTYPQSHMHGGGPPRLTVISHDEAKRKYGIP